MDDTVSAELIAQANKCFDNYDLNKNGTIEYDELKLLMTDVAKEMGIPVPSDEDVMKVMDDTDINKDRKISKEEFVTLFKIIFVMKNMKN
jgi:Ca2+-binding EF-hand superfamily protein